MISDSHSPKTLEKKKKKTGRPTSTFRALEDVDGRFPQQAGGRRAWELEAKRLQGFEGFRGLRGLGF